MLKEKRKLASSKEKELTKKTKEKNLSDFKEVSEKLIEVMEKNDIESVKKIIEEEKIDINNQDENSISALHFAAEQNNLDLLQLFVNEYNGNINATSKYNWSVLHSAASGIINEREDWKIIRWMLEKGVKTDVQAANGFTIEDVFLQKDWSYAEKYKEIVENFIKEKEKSSATEEVEKNRSSEIQTEMETEEIEAQIEISSSSQ